MIDDPHRRKTVLCPRRAGKSYAAASYLVVRCLEQPGASCIFITITRGTAKRILWGALKKLNDEFELGVVWNNTELTGTFPNGSVVRLAGSETQHDIDKFRGVPFDLVILDESKSFPPELINELIEEVLEPCLYDRMGTLCMMGTPGAVLAGAFFEATADKAFALTKRQDGRLRATSRPYSQREDSAWQGVEWRWSAHSWTMADNTAMPHIWVAVLEEHKSKGQPDDDPKWCREYLGRWVADDANFVYRYAEERNGWRPEPTETSPWGLPEGHEWRFVLGVDLGYDDPFAAEVWAYSDTHPDFWHVDEVVRPGLTVAEIAREVRSLEEKFGQFDRMVGDRAGLGKTIFATLDDTYGIHIEPADKNEKRDHIELFNSDLLAGRCHVLIGSVLAGEMTLLQWDEEKRREDKAFANHACDASVYVWRHVYHHLSRQKEKVLTPGTVEWSLEMQRQERQRVIERRRREKDLEFWENATEERERFEDSFEGWLQ